MHSYSRRWTRQPQEAVGVADAWALLGVDFQFHAPAGAIDLASNAAATANYGSQITGSGVAERSTGGVYPKFAANARYQSNERSVIVAFIPNEGTPGSGSRRIYSDFNGSTYSFVLTFDVGNVALFCHNGASGVSASWTTTVTPGKLMVLMGVASTSQLLLYANGALVASTAYSTGLRSVANGLALGGNPSGSAQGLEADFLFASQVRAPCSDALAKYLTSDWTRVFSPRRIWVPQSGGAGPSTSVALATTGGVGSFSGGASSPAVAALAAAGSSGALSATASSTTTATLAATGSPGDFSGQASSPATATLAASGASGAFSASANSSTSVALALTGDAGLFAGSAGSGSGVTLAVTGNSGAFSATAAAPATVALAALGGEGAFAGSAYPLTSAQVAALGASGAFSGAASSGAAVGVAVDGGSGEFSCAANSEVHVSLSVTGAAGTFSGAASVSSGAGATADEIWNYVLSNGLTAGQTLSQAWAAARQCAGAV